MRTAVIVLVSLLVVVAALASSRATRDMIPPKMDDFRNSAAEPYGTMTVNVDVIENDLPTEAGEVSVFYSTDGQATWTETPLAAVPDYTGGTWEASFGVLDQPVSYYFVALDDDAAAFSSPANPGDIFPPPKSLMANPGTEVGGDVTNPPDPALDLDGFWNTYSDTHIYATLSNATGTWPTAQTIFGPWYIYTAVLDNPDAGEDSLAVAMVYGNVPLIAATGLYVVDARDTSYTRIGDIEYQFEDGDLNMRCELADLYASPYFGPDNPSGYYNLGVGTATVWLANLGNAVDSSCIHSYYHRTGTGVLGGNTSPELEAAVHALSTEQGVNGVIATLSVTYSDPDGDLPTVRRVYVDGSPIEMGAGPDHDYAAGVEFTVDADLTLEDHVYYFSFSDGVATVETDPDTILLGSGVPEEPPAAAVALRSIWPSPARSDASFLFTLPEGENGTLTVYDVRGRLVKKIWSGPGGQRSCMWDGTDGRGEPVASGVYFARLSSPSGTDSGKLVFIR